MLRRRPSVLLSAFGLGNMGSTSYSADGTEAILKGIIAACSVGLAAMGYQIWDDSQKLRRFDNSTLQQQFDSVSKGLIVRKCTNPDYEFPATLEDYRDHKKNCKRYLPGPKGHNYTMGDE